jgi:hypothetical protein
MYMNIIEASVSSGGVENKEEPHRTLPDSAPSDKNLNSTLVLHITKHTII